MTLLQADDVAVFDASGRALVHPVSLRLDAGAPLVVLGETGSGKSLLAQALMGTLPPELWARGRVRIAEAEHDAAQPQGFRRLWGRAVAVLPQEPWLSLDPLMRARAQVAEAHALVRGLAPVAARRAAAADLAALGLGDEAGRRYPHELSGGMAQRVAFAAARAGGARIVVADEPTKGLDAARRDEVARLLTRALETGGGLLAITHDLALAQLLGGRLIVMREGAVVESGPLAEIFAAPQADYTQKLLDADPARWPRRARRAAGPSVVEGRRLTVSRGGRALVEGLDLTLRAGEIVGVSGPSGCGKSSLGDALLGLHAPACGAVRRIEGVARTAFQKLYQDPVSAFPRRRALGATLADVARRFGRRRAEVEALLARLDLAPALLARRPEQVSGGELQRLALLRVMLAEPRFLFADEPTSRLDPITQRGVIDLIATLAEEGCSVLLVSHDAALLDRTADWRMALGGHGTAEAAGRAAPAVALGAAG
ncbi:ABC transporter ATP-binding protein [Rubrimonas cliftonensis]|uniref:Peptide/nickel transport system ATP-binding protein n=1 Tax=Rubrimonas cliftonensis TaxID=89524 RepID=A0A1H4FBI1_9RHOB|nr:ATP-binding cassette domain-containing protein [Rubrimonas cliftonensis]SEA94654.1 peptide/nickel transport system ATP-binding protein [Rubrimonas cliftonensis]